MRFQIALPNIRFKKDFPTFPIGLLRQFHNGFTNKVANIILNEIPGALPGRFPEKKYRGAPRFDDWILDKVPDQDMDRFHKRLF